MTTKIVKPTLTPSPEVEQHIFATAQELALDYAQNFFWSSRHEWDAVNQGHWNPTPAFWEAL